MSHCNRARRIRRPVVLHNRDLVYFVRIKGLPYVKIGKSSLRNFPKRKVGLQIGCPLPLYVYGCVVCDDGPKVEHMFHELFSSSRVRGEWFEWRRDIRRWIQTAIHSDAWA